LEHWSFRLQESWQIAHVMKMIFVSGAEEEAIRWKIRWHNPDLPNSHSHCALLSLFPLPQYSLRQCAKRNMVSTSCLLALRCGGLARMLFHGFQ
jgi:hypothetical protein